MVGESVSPRHSESCGRYSGRDGVAAHSVLGVTSAGVPDEKRMRLRYAGRCRMCGIELPARSDAIYERAAKTVRCVTCSGVASVVSEEPTNAPSEPPRRVDSGIPGASARREFERRRTLREDRIRSEHRRLGGLILAMFDDPQSTRAWDTGAVGEERLGARLNELAGTFRVLHDRRIPGTSANIDHLAITPNGVLVIDAKLYRGRPSMVVEGGLFRPQVEKLRIGRRDRTKLVDGVLKQVDCVSGVVGGAVAVRGALCFVEADWPPIGGSFTTRGVDVLWPKKLYPRLAAEGPLSPGNIRELHRLLGDALSPA